MKRHQSLYQTAFVFTAIAGLLIAAIQPSIYAISKYDLRSVQDGTPFYDPRPECSDGTSISILQGEDNVQKAFNYFVMKGLTPEQSAGISGNLKQESGIDPAAVQADGKGRGIAQWETGARWDTSKGDNLKEFAAQKGADMSRLAVQLDFMWYEMTTVQPYAKSLPAVKATSTIEDATTAFEQTYELAKTPQMENRIAYAKQILQQYSQALTVDQTSCVVTCDSPSSAAIGGDTSVVRQNVLCLVQHELALWTPYPPLPRTGFSKYTDGVIGQGWVTDGGGGRRYDGEQWCADFVSWVYKQAGYPFTGGTSGGWRLPAVTQIKELGMQNAAFHYHPSAGYAPRPGDIAIHKGYDASGNEIYSHTNIVVSFDGTTVRAIGGDQGTGDNPQYFGGPLSTSVVSQYSYKGPTGDSTIGYVSPDN